MRSTRLAGHRAALAGGLLLASTRALAQAPVVQRPRADTAPAWTVHPDETLDLPTVIQRALVANPASVQGAASIRVARSGTRVASGELLPSLSLNSSVVRSDIAAGSGAVGSTGASSYAAGLGSSLELFTGGRRGANRERASADYAAAEAIDVAQRYAVILLAQRGYFETLRGEELITVAGSRVARAEQGLRFAQDRVRAGTATRSDELRARLELTSGRQQLNAARDSLQSATFALGRIVGADGPVGARAPASLAVRPLALSDSEVVRLAVASAPSVQASEAQARASEATRRAARSQYLPDVRLTGGYNVANQSPVVGGTRPGWQVAVGTSFPLFNGWQREDAVIRADAAAEVARAVSLDVTRQVRAESARLLGALRFSEQNIVLAGEAVAAAQEDLRVQTQRYRAGISTALDQLTSELAVTQAELGLVAARYNYQLVRAALEALVGRPL
jgi:outer membrane protein